MAFPTPAARNNSTSSGTSHTIALPDGIATGDRVLIAFGQQNTWGCSISGWTQIADNSAPDNVGRLQWFYRDINGTEGFDGSGDTVSGSTGAGSVQAAHRTWRFAAGTFDPSVAPAAAGTSGTSTTPDPPNLDPSTWGTEDTLWLVGMVAGSAVTINSWPGSYTQSQHQAAAGIRFAVAEREINAASQNPGSFGIASTQHWATTTVAIRPSSAVAQTVSPGLIDHSATLFAPVPKLAAGVGLIDHSMALFAPTPKLSVALPLIDHSMVLFSPTSIEDTGGAGGSGSDHYVRMRRRGMRSLQKGGM